MAFDASQKQRVSKYLAAFDFKSLFFEELGWDEPPAGNRPLSVAFDSHSYSLTPIAQKREFYLFKCTNEVGELPSPAARNKIETWLSKRYREHLIVFLDEAQTTQIWQWVRREPGQPLRRLHHKFEPEYQAGESLIQKLENLEISFNIEDDVTLVDIVGRARAGFNVERATKRFYDHFKKERNAFEDFVEGIGDSDDEDWYVSVMLNRLMFIYFIQRKGFLDGDPEYLRHRLLRMQAEHGHDKFYTFYRYFLLRLFHDGLGKPERTPELEELLGTIPYLNGGIFQLHDVEQRYPDIKISDEAFERILDFFDQYQWHLDDRPLRDDREINPDVLGYIFEKYVNQKQMGAYYTKEDITQYISQNTVVPYLFDAAKEKCRTAFEPDGPVWSILNNDPDRYIYDAVAHGCDLTIPEEIALGVDDVSRRGMWNTRTPEEYGLPTEIWRETVARRQRHEEVWLKAAGGEISQINDLITSNLDIKQFAQDVIEQCEEADLLNAFWGAINNVTVLDPTCGSGAFLFAALNILQPLYEACIDRMIAYLEEPGFVKLHPNYAKRFRGVLNQIDQHPKRTYYVLKTIMIKNLYGVDIMEEAVEICKLRFFLKLAGQVDKQEGASNMGIEPLPDIDFNIRTGNTLVGFATYEEVKRTVTSKLDFDNTMERIEEGAREVDRLTRRFREQQVELGGEVTAADKKALRDKLSELGETLNLYLATEAGVDTDDTIVYKQWLDMHKPFYWFTEFYGIVHGHGGFTVIIGNPPYTQVPKALNRALLTATYGTAMNRWSRDENLYTFVFERSLALLEPSCGYLGLILPLSIAFSTKRPFVELRKIMEIATGNWWWSHFDRIPSALFGNEVRTRCTITLFGRRNSSGITKKFTTALLRWHTEARKYLFNCSIYSELRADISFRILKVATQLQADTLQDLLTRPKLLAQDLTNSIAFRILEATAPNFPRPCVFVGGTAYNWFPAWREIPTTFKQDGTPSLPARTAGYKFDDEASADIIFALLCSSLGYWWWAVASDGFNLKKWLIGSFPISIAYLSEEAKKDVAKLGKKLRMELAQQYVFKDNKGQIGNFYLPACDKTIRQIDQALARYIDGLSEDFFEDIYSFNQVFSNLPSGRSNTFA